MRRYVSVHVQNMRCMALPPPKCDHVVGAERCRDWEAAGRGSERPLAGGAKTGSLMLPTASPLEHSLARNEVAYFSEVIYIAFSRKEN